MTEYRAAIVGLTQMGARPLPSAPVHPALGIEWPRSHAFMSVSHASAFAVSPNVEVVAACDLKEELLEQFRSDFQSIWPEVRTYTDYRTMLQDEDLHLLGVATSDHLHAQVVVDAAEAGVRGILCEKPIATTLADADRMIEACERRGVAMSVDHLRRFRPHWNGALAEFEDGALGAVRRIVGSFGAPRSMLFRNGTHLIDAVSWYAGGEARMGGRCLRRGTPGVRAAIRRGRRPGSSSGPGRQRPRAVQQWCAGLHQYLEADRK